MPRDSAAYVVVIVGVLSLIVGGLLFTVTDPVIQALFSSPRWAADTAQGQDILTWMERTWAFLPAAVLLMILMMAWIETRRSAAQP